MKNRIFLAVLFIFIGLVLGIGAGVLTERRVEIAEQKIEPIVQPLAVATPLSDDVDYEPVSEDVPEVQPEPKKVPAKVERPAAPAPEQRLDLGEYQVNPRKMETRELIPEQNAPRSGKITPDRVRQSEFPSGGFEPPKRFTIPVSSLDVRKVTK